MERVITTTASFQVALHEAGHAVIAHALGIPVIAVELYKHGERGSTRGGVFANDGDANLEHAAAVGLAGGEAERQLGEGDVSGDNSGGDERRIATFYLTNYQRQSAEHLAERLVSENAAAIWRLAKALDRETVVDGERLAKILDLPPGAPLPARRAEPDEPELTMAGYEALFKGLSATFDELHAGNVVLKADYRDMRKRIEAMGDDDMQKRATPHAVYAVSKTMDGQRVTDALPKPREKVWDWRAGRYI